MVRPFATGATLWLPSCLALTVLGSLVVGSGCGGPTESSPSEGSGGALGSGGDAASGGTSGNTGGTTACSGESCPEECPAGQTSCGGTCVDTLSSSAHCGACDSPCDGTCSEGVCQPPADRCPSIDDPDVRVRLEDDTWVIEGLGGDAETRTSFKAALERAFARLTPGRNEKESVVVEGSGTMRSDERLDIPSYTILDVCGTVHVTNDGGSGDQAPFYARNREHIEIRHATITGTPLYSMFFRRVHHLHLGKIDIQLDGSGFGIRIDNEPQNNDWGRSNRVMDVRLDDIYVAGTSNHGVETYGVDGLVVGRVVARNVGYAGLLLNATINAEVGLVDGEDVGTGTGYAVFRIANEAGRDGSEWPPGNIHVEEVRALRGGRGIFCVSDSGGLTVDRLHLVDTGNNSILLENCHQTRIGAESGTIENSGELRISQRTDEHTPTSNVTVQNLTVNGTSIRESPCGNSIRICNISGNASVNACMGTFSETCP